MEIKQYATEQLFGQRRNKRDQKIHRDKWKWQHDIPKFVGCSKSGAEREVDSITGLPQGTRKISNNLTLHL